MQTSGFKTWLLRSHAPQGAFGSEMPGESPNGVHQASTTVLSNAPLSRVQARALGAEGTPELEDPVRMPARSHSGGKTLQRGLVELTLRCGRSAGRVTRAPCGEPPSTARTVPSNVQ